MRFGNTLMLLGAVLLIVGAAVRFLPPGSFSWFGNLPGDIRHQGESATVFIPITSMLLVSVVISVVLNLIARIGG